eukprot:Gb_38075 [translate_table: standard]
MSRPGTKSASLNSSLTGSTLDASRPGGLSMPEKHGLVYKIAKGSECGPEILQSWSRKELLHILCAEMGKERKYTGLPKCKMIELLLRIVSMKESMQRETQLISLMHSTPANMRSLARRQRKREHPLRLPAATELSPSANGRKIDDSRVCKNSACRAILSSEDIFCKRCSCCICHQFDDNKDPSLWLVCSSEPPHEGNSCGLSCHLECALQNKKDGVVKNGQVMELDGGYCCASCGRVSGLIGCWRKQLNIAKDTRRVDILCYRISLSQRLLNGTCRFKELHDIVVKAARKLEEEVGPINGVPSKMARGIVSRLSTGLEVQKLCAMAVEKVEVLLSRISPPGTGLRLTEDSLPAACRVQFEDVTSTSLVVLLKEIDLKSLQDVLGYKLWHRKGRELTYPRDLTCVLPTTQRRALVSNLQPCTEYAFKIVSFTNTGDVGHTEAKCFTKSVEVIRRKIEPMMIKEPLKKCGSFGAEDFGSTSVKGEILPNDGGSSFKVRDLGKILREAWAQEHQSNGVFESSDKNTSNNQFHYCEKVGACDLDKPLVSSDSEINIFSASPLEELRDDHIRCNLAQVAEPEDAQGDSICVLDEERVMAGMGLVQMSHAHGGSQKVFSNSDDDNKVINLPKRDHENHSKVTVLEKAPNSSERNLLTRSDMEVVPFDCSLPVLPVNSCKLDDSRAGIFGNGHTKSNSSDSENWAVQPIRKVPAVESLNGLSRKRTLSTYNDFHDCERALQNGVTISPSDSPGCLEKNYEYCVKIIRWLECEGHIKEDFRMKFLTWFSLRSTAQERRIVYVFIDTLLDDPSSLAGQLVDAFLEIISNKRPQILRNGFCSKLWH